MFRLTGSISTTFPQSQQAKHMNDIYLLEPRRIHRDRLYDDDNRSYRQLDIALDHVVICSRPPPSAAADLARFKPFTLVVLQSLIRDRRLRYFRRLLGCDGFNQVATLLLPHNHIAAPRKHEKLGGRS